MPDAPPADFAADELLCPACGYDLRALAGDRCPECGLSIDREQLKESSVPWVHRRSIGRVRAYTRTVWWMLIGTKRLAFESAKPQKWEDARSFRRVTAVLLAIELLAILHFSTALSGGTSEALQLQRPANRAAAWYAQSYGLDLCLPWSAGAILPLLLPCALVGWAGSLLVSPRALFGTRKLADARRVVGTALATYAVSPIVLVGGLIGPLWWINYAAPSSVVASVLDAVPVVGLLLVLITFLLIATAGLGLLAAIVRPIRWFGRVAHAGGGQTLLAALRWVMHVLGVTLFWLVLLPWAVGFFWLMIDSFRP